MKHALLVALLASSVTLAHAADLEGMCESVADMSTLVAQQRDEGMPLSEMKRQIIRTPLRADVRTMFLNLAIAVYVGPQYVNLAPNQARSFTYQQCMGAN